MQAKRICSQFTKQYQLSYNKLKDDYEKAKVVLVNSLTQKIKELAIFSTAFSNLSHDIMKIQNDGDLLQSNKEFVNTVKEQLKDKLANVSFRNNTIKK